MNFGITEYFILHIKQRNVNPTKINHAEYYVYEIYVAINVTSFKSLGYQAVKKTKKSV